LDNKVFNVNFLFGPQLFGGPQTDHVANIASPLCCITN